MPSRSYDNTPATVPTRTAPQGFSAALTILKRVRSEVRREALTDLCYDSGLQGAPAFDYFARLLCWYLDGAESLPVPSKLKVHEADAVRSRARAACEPLVAALGGHDAWVAAGRLGID